MNFSSSLAFAVNGELHVIENPDPEITLLKYLRSVGLTGTKMGCNEGGCGACSIVLQAPKQNGQNFSYFAINSCLAPLCGVEGMNVITVEGVGSSEKMHPIQEKMAKNGSSQCGMCTPGIVMSMYALLQKNPDRPPSRADIELNFDGNLCRCTGYRPILEAFGEFAEAIPAFQHHPFPKELLNRAAAGPFVSHGPRCSWFRPANLDQFLVLKLQYPNARIVGGNSELEIDRKFRNAVYGSLITTTHVAELNAIEETPEGLNIGAGVRLSQLEAFLRDVVAKQEEGKTRFMKSTLEMLRWFASTQIRNTAAIGGNIATASPISDLNPLWMAFDSPITIISAATREIRKVSARNFFISYRKVDLEPEEVIMSVFLRYSDASKNEYCGAYKQSRRREDDIAIVNAATYISFADDGQVQDAHFAFGGMAPKSVSAPKAAASIIGHKLSSQVISNALEALAEDLPLPPGAPGGMIEYRRSLASSFLYKFFVYASTQKPNGEPVFSAHELSAASFHERPLTSAIISHHEIALGKGGVTGSSVPHLSAKLQVTGEAEYTDDIPVPPNTLYAALVMSTIPHGKILSVDASASLAMPGVKAYVGAKDIPAAKYFGSIAQDEEVFASEYVHHVGQVIGVICAENATIARRAAAQVKVKYEPLPSVLSIDDAIKANSFYEEHLSLEKGDVESAMAAAPFTLEGEARIGGQEHFYLETQASFCIPQEAGEMTIWASTQHPTKTQSVVAAVLGVPKSKVVVRVKRMGGGFGGKETRSIFLTTVLAVAAKKVNAPVKIMLERDEDMCITGQRHPFFGKYKVGYDAQGKLLAVDVDLYSNAGAFLDLSGPVMEKALFQVDGAYYCENVRFRGNLCKTNLPPNTAFRGFGAPQGTIIAENYMDDIGRSLTLPPDSVRRLNLYKEGEMTHFTQPLIDCHLVPMWEELEQKADYATRRKEIEEFNAKNRYRKRGMAITPIKFGMSFEPFMNSASALVHVYTDGSVLVSHAGTEMGQGLHTKMAMVAADALNVPLSSVHIRETSTDACANTHPTAASVSADMNGMAIYEACLEIKDRMSVVFKEKPGISFADAASECWFRRIDLSAHGFYRTPDIGWDWSTKTGRPFHYISYGAGCAEVEVDCLTGDHIVRRVDLIQDVGKSLNPAIDIGQIEGGFVQGYGLFCLEELVWTPSGSLFTRGPSTYKIPSFNDIPLDFRTSLYNSAGTHGRTIMSSKGVGEPPLLLATAVVFAIKDAVGSARSDFFKESNVEAKQTFRLECPTTCERIRMACPDMISAKITTNAESFVPTGFW